MRTFVGFIGTGLALVSVAACGEEETKEPVKIGLSASLTGFDEEFGATAQEVTVAAVASINDAGGINGHQIELIIRDDGSDLVADGGKLETAIEELRDEGVVAIIGPFLSGLTGVATPIAQDASITLISPSATNPALATFPDDGFMFRTAPNDSIQVRAIAHYFEDLVDPAVTEFAIIHEEGDYGEGLRDALDARWTGTITGTPISYPTGLDGDAIAASAAWDAIVAADPDVVVAIGQGSDTNVLVNTWIASQELPALTWFFADGSKISSFFGSGGSVLDPEAEGLRGTAPTSPLTSVAYTSYIDAVGDELSGVAYFPNTWDAVYLIAAALTQQSANSEDFGGTGLRDAVNDVSSGGQIFHAGQWRDLVSQLRDGGDVDYDGASGPVDFDADGEVVSPYEVWETTRETGDWSFKQVEYMEAADLD